MMTVAFALVALLYAAVGHGGASGYLAVMALAGLEPSAMKPTALILNITVSTLGTVAFFRAGHFRSQLFWRFALVSVPCAFMGGRVQLHESLFRLAVAGVLAFAALRLLLPTREAEQNSPPPVWAILLIGSLIGFLSGMIGVGGGIFLTPLLIVARWAGAREAAAVSAPFILVNSIAGLMGNWNSLENVPSGLPLWLLAVLVGGWLGSQWGSKRAQPAHLRRALSVVLIFATVKLVLS